MKPIDLLLNLKTRKIVLSAFLLLSSAYAFSQSSTDKYLEEMPSVERIMADFGGPDSLTASASQVAVFRILPDWMALITDNEMGVKERSRLYNKMHAMYREAEGKITNRIVNSFDPDETKRLGMSSPRAKWYNKTSELQHSQAVKNKLLQLYFSEAWKTRYKKLKAASDSIDREATINASPSITLAPSTPSPVKSEKDFNYSRLIILLLGVAIFLGLFPYLVFKMRKQPVYENRVLLVNGTEHNIYSLTGTVVDSTKTSTTRTYTSGGGYDSEGRYSAPTTHTSTTIHDQIFLIDKNQQEHVVQLSGWNLPTRAGNELTMIWAIKKGMKEGPYIIALNHSTNMKYHMESRLAGIFKITWKRWYLIGLLAMFIMPVLWGMQVIAEVRSHTPGSVASPTGSSVEDHGITYLYLWAIHLISWIVGAILAARTSRSWMKNFVDSIRMEDYKMK